jgi:hypothetical protein
LNGVNTPAGAKEWQAYEYKHCSDRFVTKNVQSDRRARAAGIVKNLRRAFARISFQEIGMARR